MNLLNKFSQDEIELAKNAGIFIENKEYDNSELEKFEMQIAEYIISHSLKGKEIDVLNIKYSNILKIIRC